MAKTKKIESNPEKDLKNVTQESKIIKKKVKKDKLIVKNEDTKEAVVNPSKKTSKEKAGKPQKEKTELNEKPKQLTSESILEKVARKKAKKIAQKLKKKLNKKNSINENNKKRDDGKAEKHQKSEDNNETTKSPSKANLGKKLLKKLENSKNESEKAQPNYNDPTVLASTIFVGNLPITTKRAQILSHFKEFGPIKTVRFRTANGKKIFKQKMRKEAGNLIAYLVLKNEQTAKRALALNNSEFKGNHLRVTPASEKRSSKEKDKCTVLVGNLKYSATEEKLREIFSSCGEIEYIRCMQANPKDIAAATKKDIKAGCKGIAYVCFKSPESVGLALELKETMLDERPINVERYTSKKQGALKARQEAEQLAAPTKKFKKNKDNKSKDVKGKGNANDEDSATKKKNVYHGVKIDNIKKKKKSSKVDKQLKAVAKKIAPKTTLSK